MLSDWCTGSRAASTAYGRQCPCLIPALVSRILELLPARKCHVSPVILTGNLHLCSYIRLKQRTESGIQLSSSLLGFPNCYPCKNEYKLGSACCIAPMRSSQLKHVPVLCQPVSSSPASPLSPGCIPVLHHFLDAPLRSFKIQHKSCLLWVSKATSRQQSLK